MLKLNSRYSPPDFIFFLNAVNHLQHAEQIFIENFVPSRLFNKVCLMDSLMASWDLFMVYFPPPSQVVPQLGRYFCFILYLFSQVYYLI